LHKDCRFYNKVYKKGTLRGSKLKRRFYAYQNLIRVWLRTVYKLHSIVFEDLENLPKISPRFGKVSKPVKRAKSRFATSS